MFILPYELVNRIMEYLAHLNNAKYALCVDSNFREHLRVNIYCSAFQRINAIQIFKSTTLPPRTVTLHLRRGNVVREVEAEEMSLIPTRSNRSIELSYTYLEPTDQTRNTIYVRKNHNSLNWYGQTYEGYEYDELDNERVEEYQHDGTHVSIRLVSLLTQLLENVMGAADLIDNPMGDPILLEDGWEDNIDWEDD